MMSLQSWLSTLVLGSFTAIVPLALGAGTGGGALASAGPAQVVALEFQATTNELRRWTLPVVAAAEPFAKEPALSRQLVFRGLLRMGNHTNHWLAFVWDIPQRRLFLDLNRNLDLTDDPAGVLTSAYRDCPQVFTAVRLGFPEAQGERPCLVDLILHREGQRPGVNAALRSFWQGKFMAGTREWQLGLVESQLGESAPEGPGDLLLRPWPEAGQAADVWRGSPDLIKYNPRLCFQERAWRLDWRFGRQEGAPQYLLELREQHPQLGELRLSGEFLHRLVLEGQGGYTAVVEASASGTKVPTGIYKASRIWLRQGGVEAFGSAASLVIVSEKGSTGLRAGGPLTNTVTVQREGQWLRFNYQLLGAGRTPYRLGRTEGRSLPQWAVYRDGHLLASNLFQAGPGGAWRAVWPVPLTVAGDLTVMASRDLAGFGSPAGPPASLLWPWPGLVRQLLPVGVILGLLWLRPNRALGAWLVWLPLAALLGFDWLLNELTAAAPWTVFKLSLHPLAFGWAAVWLLFPGLVGESPLRSILRTGAALAGFSLLAMLMRGEGLENWAAAGDLMQALGFCSLTSALALIVAGVICRGRFGRMGFVVSFLVGLAFFWCGAVAPFFWLEYREGQLGWFHGLRAVFLGTLMAGVPAVAYLIFCFFQRFYYARFQPYFELEESGLLSLASATRGTVLTSLLRGEMATVRRWAGRLFGQAVLLLAFLWVLYQLETWLLNVEGKNQAAQAAQAAPPAAAANRYYVSEHDLAFIKKHAKSGDYDAVSDVLEAYLEQAGATPAPAALAPPPVRSEVNPYPVHATVSNLAVRARSFALPRPKVFFLQTNAPAAGGP